LVLFTSLEHFISIKKENYRLYRNNINDKVGGLKILDFRDGIRSNYWFYSLYITNLNKYSCKKIIRNLADENIQSRPIWGLIHEQKPYLNHQAYMIERAPDYHKRIINLPCSSNLSVDNVYKVINKICAI